MSLNLNLLGKTFVVLFVAAFMFMLGCGTDDPPGLWTVDERNAPSVVFPPGASPSVLESNLLRYTYVSRITYNWQTATFLEQGEFDVTDYHNGFIPGANKGDRVVSAMSDGHYQMIGDFLITGRVDPDGAMIENGSIHLYLDLTPANGSRNKDILIGSADHLLSGGAGAPEDPNALGSYDAIYDDYMLTEEGKSYWTAPQPFYVNMDFFGDVLTSTPVPGAPNVYDTTGVGGAYFL